MADSEEARITGAVVARTSRSNPTNSISKRKRLRSPEQIQTKSVRTEHLPVYAYKSTNTLITRDGDGLSHIDKIAYSDDANCEMDGLLEQLGNQPSTWLQLLLSKDSRGDTPMHRAVAASDSSHWLGVVFSEIDWDLDSKSSLLTAKNNRKEMPMAMAIRLKKTSIISAFMNAFKKTNAERRKLFEISVVAETGDTVIHQAVKSNFHTGIKEILPKLQTCSRKQILSALDINKMTALHMAAEQGSKILINAILDPLDKSERFELLKQKNGKGQTAIHLLAERKLKEVSEMLTKYITPDQLPDLLEIADNKGRTAFHYATRDYMDVKFATSLASLIQPDMLVSLLKIKDILGNTVLHNLTMPVVIDSQDTTVPKRKLLSKHKAHPDCQTILAEILENLKDQSASEKRELFCIENNLQGTVLQYAIDMFKIEPKITSVVTNFLTMETLLKNVLPNSPEVAETLLSSTQPTPSIEAIKALTPEERYFLRCIVGKTAKQLLKNIKKADNDHFKKRLEEIKSYSGTDTTRLREITEEKFDNGNTILHVLAERDEYEAINKLLSHCPELRREGSVNRHGQTPYELAKKESIEDLLEWSKKQEGFYYLPTKPSVLVMYSTDNRKGFDQEVVSFVEVMQKKLAITPLKVENPTRSELLHNIRLAQSQPNLSALIVVYMSHGCQAHVQTSDGLLHIGDILSTMCSPSLKSKPKILMIQACQGAINPADPTPGVQRSWFSTGVHYDVQHCDVVSIVASVSTGLAYRNLMIPKFSEELGKADKNVDITEIFAKTNEEVTKTSAQIRQGSIEQICELRSTLTKKLSLTNVFK